MHLLTFSSHRCQLKQPLTPKHPFRDISSLCTPTAFSRGLTSSRFNLLPSQIRLPTRWDTVTPGQWGQQDRGCQPGDGDGTWQPRNLPCPQHGVRPMPAQSFAPPGAGWSLRSLAMVPQSPSSLQLGLGSTGWAAPVAPACPSAGAGCARQPSPTGPAALEQLPLGSTAKAEVKEVLDSK